MKGREGVAPIYELKMALHSGGDLMLPRVFWSSLVTSVPPTAEKLCAACFARQLAVSSWTE